MGGLIGVGLMVAIIILAAAVGDYMQAKGKAMSAPRAPLPNNLDERLRKIESALDALQSTRETSLEHTLSVEKNFEMLQSRLSNVERRVDQENTQSTSLRAE